MSDLFASLSLAGASVFAISGALMALRHRMDLIGIIFLAGVTGIGGGTVRDLLLGRTPVSWVEDPTTLGVCALSALVVVVANPYLIGRRLRWLLYADAAGLALFAVVGTSTALASGAHPAVAVLFGAVSASFGGILRDVICAERPILLQKDVYITAALVAGAVYALAPDGIDPRLRNWASVGAGFFIRAMAIRFAWRLPYPRYGSE